MLLEHNGMSVEGKAGPAWLAHRLADALAFGRIGLCPVCKSDAVAHNSVEYVCYGHISQFTRCTFKGNHPEMQRFRFNLPKKGIPKAIAAFEFSADYPTKPFEVVKRARDDESSGGEEGA